MPTTIPEGLTGLLIHGLLPSLALQAAADQRDLQPALARRPQLPGAAIERCFVTGVLPPAETARALLDRPLAYRTVRHVLCTAGERRPTVLAALARHNVPAGSERQLLLTGVDQELNEAVLANPAWPANEQIRVAHRAGGEAVLQWLSQLDPAVNLTISDVLGENEHTRLDADPLVALRAMLRRPWLAALPLHRAGPGLRSAIATVTDDERTLYRLLGHAERDAVYGRSSRAATLVEAVACNPAAPLGVQRRCRVIARRLRCHYLKGWLPARTTPGPLWEADPDTQRAAMTRIEELTAVRHRTVFSAGMLAANQKLAGDVRERIIVYLDNHLTAVDQDPSTITVLAHRLQVDDTTHTRWLERCQPTTGRHHTSHPEPAANRRRQRPTSNNLTLPDCADKTAARTASRKLRAQLGHNPDAWSIALLLLREGWTTPLADLPQVVSTLTYPDAATPIVA